MGKTQDLDCFWKFLRGTKGYTTGEGNSLSKKFDGSYRCLVKESLQNSIDARVDFNQPVKEKYTINHAKYSD